jgi:NAD(P)-dependent dehydrogenase (short-subunit alcohol dehydrogenase family)
MNTNSNSNSKRLAGKVAAVSGASKGTVDAITRSLAAELGPRRIRVNAISGCL